MIPNALNDSMVAVRTINLTTQGLEVHFSKDAQELYVTVNLVYIYKIRLFMRHSFF